MSYRAVLKGKEYWRLGTSVFLFDLDNPLDAYTLVRWWSHGSLAACRFDENLVVVHEASSLV